MALLCLCLYRFVLIYFLFCYYPWIYILNVQTSRSKNIDFFSIVVQVVRNLFWKNVPHIWANFNHSFKVFQSLLFALLLYQKDSLETRFIAFVSTKRLNQEIRFFFGILRSVSFCIEVKLTLFPFTP